MPRGMRIGFHRALRVAGDVGSYTTVGQAASVLRQNRLTAALGAYGVTGQAAILDKTGSTAPQDPADITTFSLIAGSSGSAIPFSIGQAFKQGDIAVTDEGVSVIGATAQVTPKNYWPDGSLKFAVISGTASLTGGTPSTITVRRAAPSNGTALTLADLQATGITADFGTGGAYGSATFSNGDFGSPFESWISGHRMSSWVFRKPFGSDAHLVAWMEVRLYAGGAVEVLPWIENGYCDVASPASKSATYTFALGGVSKFSGAIYLYARQRTVLVSGTVTSYWLGTAHDVIVKHEPHYLQDTELVPAYSTDISPTHAEVTGLPSSFTPLQQGAFDSSLASGGFHNHVCLLPQWDALHLTTTATSTYKAVIYQGYSAGRYAFHFRDEATNRVPRINDSKFATRTHPGLGSSPFPAASESPPTSMLWSIDHQPMVGYLPYLITGRYYFLEEVQFLASTNFFLISTGARNNGSGWFAAHSNSNESPRTCAWGIRGLTYAAAVTPDADPQGLRAAYMAHLKNNIDFYWGMYRNSPANPQGWIYAPTGTNVWGYYVNLNGPVQSGSTATTVRMTNDSVKNTTLGSASFVGQKMLVTVASFWDHMPTITGWTQGAGYVEFTVTPAMSGAPQVGQTAQMLPPAEFQAPWMQDYSIAVWGHMKSLQLPFDATTEARRESFWAWHAGAVVGRMGFIGSTEYLYRDCANYSIAVGKMSSDTQGPNWITGAGPWFANWGEVYDATFKTNGGLDTSAYTAPYALQSRTQGAMRSSGFDLADTTVYQSQFANMMRAIAYAVKHNVAGAEAGWQRITSSANYHKFVQGMEIAGFSQGALAPEALPKWRRGVGVNQWVEIAGSDMNTTGQCANIVRTLDGESYGKENADGGRLDSYGGLTVDTRRSRLWVAAGGGHGDYYGNEVVYQDLMADAPVWAIQFAGSNGNVMDVTTPGGTASLARYADGLPASRHTYGQTQFIERHNRVVTTGGSISFSGTGFQDIEGFDVDATTAAGWAALYAYPGAQGSVGAAGAIIAATCCKDPTTEVIYTFSSNKLHKVTPSLGGPTATAGSGGTYSFLPLGWDSAYPYSEGAAAVDTARSRILWTNGYGIGQYSIDIADGSVTPVTYTGAAASALAAESASSGMVYVPRLDAYLFRAKGAGPTVYTINASSFAVTTLSTNDGDGIPAQAGSGSGGGGYGVYNKWQFVPVLRGVVYISGAGHNTWFLRLY